MLSLNGISAWIEVDGKELEQYGVEECLAQNQVTCWVATQAEKCFSVVFRDNAGYREHSLGSFLELDGAAVRGKVLHPPIGNSEFPNFVMSRTVVQNGQVLSATSSRPFVFAKLELTDEDDYLDHDSAHLGEIQIRIHRVQVVDSHIFHPVPSAPSLGKIHERSKKAVSHCVSYGQEVKMATQYSSRVRYIDGNTPLATFIFRYRDFSLLQANGIIPKPPLVKRKTAVREEVLDLTTGNHVKPEPTGDEVEIVNVTQKSTPVFVSKRSNPVRESEARPLKRVKQEKRFASNEVIDLT